MAGALLLLLACGRTGRSQADDAPEAPASGASSGGGVTVGAAAGRGGQSGGGGAAAVPGSVGGSSAGGNPLNGAGEASAGGSGGAPACEASALQITGTEAIDEDGDGLFESLEQVHVSADLLSPLKSATVKLSVVSDDPDVQLVEGGINGVRLERTLHLEAGVPLHVTVSYVITERASTESEVGFKLTLEGPGDEPCVTAAAEEQVITVRNYVWQGQTCDMTRQVELSNPYVVNGNGGSTIRPGEDFELRVTLNPGPLGHDSYPGIVATSSDPGVSERDGAGGWLFALVAPVEVTWGMHATAAVAPGSMVELSLTPAALHVRCRDVSALTFLVPVE